MQFEPKSQLHIYGISHPLHISEALSSFYPEICYNKKIKKMYFIKYIKKKEWRYYRV
jgi:hypothetical protein